MESLIALRLIMSALSKSVKALEKIKETDNTK